MRHSSRGQTLTNVLVRVRSLVVLVSVLAIGVLVLPASRDVYRFPKDILVRAEAILLAACWILLAVRGVRPPISDRHRPVWLLVIASLTWVIITSLFSTNRALSVASAGWAAAIATILLTSYFVAGARRRPTDLWYLTVPALLNAVLAILQATDTWNPFRFLADVSGEQRVTGLIGNPNELGSYLVLPVVVCTASAVARRQRRWFYATLAAVLLLGLVATRTRTAMIACAVGLVCIACMKAKTRRAIVVRLAVTILVIGAVIGAAVGARGYDLRRFERIEVLDQVSSFRVPPFLAAWQMFKDHPLMGVGPGCWAYWYFDYKIAVERAHPALFHTGLGFSNFGEVHNDHLQILAVGGVPGYLLFLALLIFIGWHSFRGSGEQADTEGDLERLARLLAFPATAALFVLCMAQFPLQLASTTTEFGFVLATAVGWLRR